MYFVVQWKPQWLQNSGREGSELSEYQISILLSMTLEISVKPEMLNTKLNAVSLVQYIVSEKLLLRIILKPSNSLENFVTGIFFNKEECARERI